MTDAQLNIKALRILDLAKQLQSIMNELEVEINAPIKVKKPTQRAINKAKVINRIEAKRWQNQTNK